jgi:predicted KAP-like P-loop ATPase
LFVRIAGAKETSSFLPDEPIDNASRFGFNVYSEALTRLIKSKELQTPFTIAIHGDWGSGKTSLMKTVCKSLEKKNNEDVKLRTIWFDAWEFERLSIPLWKVFLNKITSELTEFVKEEGKKSIRDNLKKIGEGVLLLSSDVILKKLIGISLEQIQDVKAKVGKDIKEIDTLRENLSKCIEEVLKNDSVGAQRIVIFIDDLNRCLPEHVVEVFESIKLFLSSKNCVFVIGVNKEQICKAFESKFGKGGPSGLHYMEKFIQLQFDLPRKNPLEVQSFLSDFATKKLKENPKTIELIASFIEPNPRKVKR